MLRWRKKKKKDPKSTEDVPEVAQANSLEQLVEKKATEIRQQIQKINPENEVDLSTIPQDLSDLEAEIRQEELAEQQKKDLITDQTGIIRARLKPEIKDIIPVWVEKPFYYITPAEKLQSRRMQWLEAWGSFLLQWANAKDIYIIIILDLLKEFPFKNPLIKKALTPEQLVLIGDYLTDKEQARWQDKRKTQLRLYWESVDETAENVYQWAFDRGQRYVGVFDLLEANQPWSSLPTQELYTLLVILVTNKKAQWADRKKEMVYMIFPV